MVRFLLVSILAHVLIMNFVWVGFSVSMARKNSLFIYLGETLEPAQGMQARNTLPSQDFNGNVDIVKEDSSVFNSWLKMRQVNKPH